MPETRLNFTEPNKVNQNNAFAWVMNISPALRFSIVFVGIVLLLWLALFVTGMIFQRSIRTTQNEIHDLQSKRLPKLEDSVLRLPPQLAFASKKFREHTYGTNVFTFLRENTLKHVTLTDVDFERQDGKIKTNGFATSFEDIAKQLSFLKSNSNVSHLQVSGIALSDGGLVKFSLAYQLSQKFLMTP